MLLHIAYSIGAALLCLFMCYSLYTACKKRTGIAITVYVIYLFLFALVLRSAVHGG